MTTFLFTTIFNFVLFVALFYVIGVDKLDKLIKTLKQWAKENANARR